MYVIPIPAHPRYQCTSMPGSLYARHFAWYAVSYPLTACPLKGTVRRTGTESYNTSMIPGTCWYKYKYLLSFGLNDACRVSLAMISGALPSPRTTDCSGRSKTCCSTFHHWGKSDVIEPTHLMLTIEAGDLYTHQASHLCHKCSKVLALLACLVVRSSASEHRVRR